MADFMGIHGVVDAEPILGSDGITDGFVVRYIDDRSYVDARGRWIEKKVECQKTVWVREYDFNSRGNDGGIHGFGRGEMFVRVTSAEKKRRAESRKAKVTKSGLECVASMLGKRVGK